MNYRMTTKKAKKQIKKTNKKQQQSKTNSYAQNTPCHNRLICYNFVTNVLVLEFVLDPSDKSHYALDMCPSNVHTWLYFVTKWCIVGYGSGALLDLYKFLLSGQRLSAQLSFNHATWLARFKRRPDGFSQRFWYLRRHLERDAWKQEIL